MSKNRKYQWILLGMVAVASVIAIALPPEMLAKRFVPKGVADIEKRTNDIYYGLWYLKIALGLNAVAWLCWPLVLKTLNRFRSPQETKVNSVRIPTWEWVAIAFVALLALGLRIYRVDASLSFDEAFLAEALIKKGPGAIYLLGCPIYSQMSCWHVWILSKFIGLSEFTIRLPSILYSVGAVVGTFWLLRKWTSDGLVSLSAALLLAIAPFSVMCAQEIKGYPATSFFGIIALWCFLKAIEHGQPKHWIWVGVAAFFMGYAHALSWCLIGALCLVALIHPARKRLLIPLAAVLTYAVLGLGLVFAGSIPRLREIRENLHEIHLDSMELGEHFVQYFGVMLGSSLGSWFLLGLVVVGAIRLFRIQPWAMVALILAVAGYFVANMTVFPYTFTRYLSFSMPGYMICAALGMASLAEAASQLASSSQASRIKTGLILLLLAVWIWPVSQGLRSYYDLDRFGFKAVWQELKNQGVTKEQVMAVGFGAKVFGFYLNGVEAIRGMPEITQAIEKKRPPYVVVFYSKIFEENAKSAKANPLQGYHRTFLKEVMMDENKIYGDGAIWQRDDIQPEKK